MRRTFSRLSRLSRLAIAACMLSAACLDNTPPIVAEIDDAGTFRQDASTSSPPSDASGEADGSLADATTSADATTPVLDATFSDATPSLDGP